MKTSDEELENALVLALPPELWEVDLRGGGVLTVIAHSRSVDGSDAVFSLLFDGNPAILVESLRIPLLLLPEDYDLLDKID